MKRFSVVAQGLLVAQLALSQPADATNQSVRGGTIPYSWITGGPKCMEVPDWQIHEYNPDFYIIRESGCVNYEKPFLYLLFGSRRAILFDTGSGETTIGPTITKAVTNWLSRTRKSSIELIVAHTHAHEDHIAGDAQFRNLKNPAISTIVLPLDVKATQTFYSIQKWPDDIGSVDLGDRVIDVIPIPGHDYLSIAFYDRQTGILLSGDTLCAGRLYVDVADFKQFKQSVQRMVTFTEGKVITHILGAHVEERRTPFQEYPFGTIYQPDEHDLSLSRAHLLELREALNEMGDKPVVRAMSDYTISPADAAGWKIVGSKLDETLKDSQSRMWD